MNKDKVIKDLKKRNDQLSDQYRLRDIRCVHLEHENQRLKEQIKELEIKYINRTKQYEKAWDMACNIDELRSWLEDEKDRLARECSQIYEDSLGKTRLVNEDIFNEVNRIISKLNELEENKNDR